MRDEDHDGRAAIRAMISAGELDAAGLQIIADGPIMDPVRIYLPAGKLSESDWRARERRIRAGLPA